MSSPARPNDITFVDTEDEGFYQEVLVPLRLETHGGEEVVIYAGGPWSHLFHRTHEQYYIYQAMKHAARLDKRRRPWWPDKGEFFGRADFFLRLIFKSEIVSALQNNYRFF